MSTWRPDQEGDDPFRDDEGSVSDGKKPRDSQATELVRLAEQHYRFACADDGRSFAVPIDGAAIAKPLDGNRGLRTELAATYFASTGKAPGRSALLDAISVLDGRAQTSERETLALRVHHEPGRILVDLGTVDGCAVEVTSSGWNVIDRAPVVFRRTELTGALPAPRLGGSLTDLRDLVNVSDESWPLLVGWLVGSYFDIPRPALFVTGEQGTGKSQAARTITNLIDASPVPLRAAPRDVEAWIIAAAGSHVVCLDNLSVISEWLSDALCRAATGEGLVRRALYTNGGLSVTTFRRAVVLTSIDPGALRGDLGERLLPIELERIRPEQRRTDADLAALFTATHPTMLGDLLTLVAQVLEVLPTIAVSQLPRMADFGRVLAALDHLLGWSTLDAYRTAVDAVAAEVVSGDPLGAALLQLAEHGTWVGTASELMKALADYRPDGAPWPKTPRSLSGALTRLAPALRTVGVEAERGKANGARMIHIRRTNP